MAFEGALGCFGAVGLSERLHWEGNFSRGEFEFPVIRMHLQCSGAEYFSR